MQKLQGLMLSIRRGLRKPLFLKFCLSVLRWLRHCIAKIQVRFLVGAILSYLVNNTPDLFVLTLIQQFERQDFWGVSSATEIVYKFFWDTLNTTVQDFSPTWKWTISRSYHKHT